MKIKYLYLDDSEERTGIARGLSIREEVLEVTPSAPVAWSDILKLLESYDGLLLDWQLQLAEQKGDYSSSALGQEIREAVNQSILPHDIPIILCSAQDEFQKRFQRDKTSHDLFDAVFPKEVLASGDNEVINQFVALATGYELLNSVRDINKILSIDPTDLELLDIRLVDELQKRTESPAHELARFILKEVIDFEGILIDESVLAARLGVDITSNDWVNLKDRLSNTKYSGVFSSGWQRWWWHRVEKVTSGRYGISDLRGTSAKERVECIVKAEGLDLVAAAPMEYCTSDEFWTVCYATKSPIDRYDAFLVDLKTNYPWQESFYVSKKAVVEEINSDQWEINVIDKQRVANFKEALNDE